MGPAAVIELRPDEAQTDAFWSGHRGRDAAVTVRLVALHGFLGRASDWDGLAGHLPGVSLHALDLWKVLGESGAHDWETAASALDAALAAVAVQTEGPAAVPAASAAATRDMARSAFVVGYSLGARLALGSRLLSSPGSPARGCCFVSCNPGLADADVASRRARRVSDAAWARRILEEPEDTLWQAWDAQPVFAGSARPDDSRCAAGAARTSSRARWAHARWPASPTCAAGFGPGRRRCCG